MPADPVSLPWRRFLRFSVRGLIVFVIVVGAGLGWTVRQAHIQRDAVMAIKKSGGSVAYGWAFWDGNDIRGGKPWAPRWLVDHIGIDYFAHVTAVWLYWSSTPTDSSLGHVGRLTRLQELYDHSRSTSDAGLAHLKGLTGLSSLILPGNGVTDAGLAHLEGLTNLSTLDLRGTQVTDAGLVHLTELTHLKRLYLSRTQVTGAGAKELNQALPSLQIIR
jgi:Leucine Rich repeat